MRIEVWDIFVMAMFAVSGVALLVLTWTDPMTPVERIVTSFVGALAVLTGAVSTILLKFFTR